MTGPQTTLYLTGAVLLLVGLHRVVPALVRASRRRNGELDPPEALGVRLVVGVITTTISLALLATALGIWPPGVLPG